MSDKVPWFGNLCGHRTSVGVLLLPTCKSYMKGSYLTVVYVHLSPGQFFCKFCN